MEISDGYIDIGNLPESAKKQLFDFWEFLSEKYAKPETSSKNFELGNIQEKIINLKKLVGKIENPSISDPVIWQIETRKDRAILGRES
jgi:hypothetical protein